MSKRRHPRFSATAAMEPTAIAELSGAATSLPKPPKRRVGRDPAFIATLIKRPTMKRLRKLQKTFKPTLNLKFLSEACHLLALDEIGGDRVVKLAHSLSREDAPS